MTAELLDLALIEKARSRIQSLPPTPLLRARSNLWLKLENLQPTGSFKVRGFLNAVTSIDAGDLKSGIVTVSAGNAALAAAYVSNMVEVPCKVVMFDSAPETKRRGVEELGAHVLSWTREKVLDWMANEGWKDMKEKFIHPFADEEVMAGHGTLALELLDQLPDLERVFVPVGGGGLVSGISSGMRASEKSIEVIGVQSSGYPLWLRTISEGQAPKLTPNTIADGTTAPYHAGMHPLLSSAVDRWVEVQESELRRAVAELARAHKVVVEGAGALSFRAALDEGGKEPSVAVISGGNIDPALLTTLMSE